MRAIVSWGNLANLNSLGTEAERQMEIQAQNAEDGAAPGAGPGAQKQIEIDERTTDENARRRREEMYRKNLERLGVHFPGED